MLEKIGLPTKPAMRGSNWVVDASHCQGCSSQFTFINRKHHCRRCGGLFCNSCTQQRMLLRGQGDSPVRICEPCKKLEEATRFEMRHGHKSRAGRGGSKLTSTNEDDIINQILGSDKKVSASSRELSTTNVDSRLQRDSTSASCSNIQQVTTIDEEEETPGNLSVEEFSPEELRQQALDEKKKYKLLKGEGKSEEALRAFKKGKELERQAAALELLLRKNRKRALPLSSTTEILEINEESSNSGRKSKISPEKSKGKDDLASELIELGWSDMDLHDSDKKPATMSLEGELSTLLREVSQKSNTETGSRGIDKSQVLAMKKKALMLKREGKLGEAKEELKKAKVLEKKLEEEEFLAEAEDSDDELSALIRSMDSDKQDTFSVAYKEDAGFDLGQLLRNPDDLGVDSNFEVSDEDLYDPEMDAALKSLGWTDDANHFEDKEPQFVPIDKESLSNEIQSLKREALNQKRAGNNGEALELLRKAKVLEKDLDNYVTKGNDLVPHNAAIVEKGSAVQSAEKVSKPKLAPKSRLTIQKELLALKKRALALRREGKLDEADEELEKGKVLEQQLEEMDNVSNMKAPQVDVSKKNADNIADLDVGVVGEGDVTDQDMTDPTYLSLLSNLGWNEGDDNNVGIPPKPAKQAAASSIQIGASRRSKGEIQRELLGLKRKALAFRRQGDNDGAEEVLEMAKALEAQLEEMELPKKVVQYEISNPIESETISSSHNSTVGGDEISETVLEKSPERIASISDNPATEEMGSNEKITYVNREEAVLRNEKNDPSSIRQEILILKRKAVGFKREGKLADAREELRKAKVLEKSLEDENVLTVTSSSHVASTTSSTSKELSSSNVGSKPISSRDRFKLQQESLSHKRLAMKLRREGRMEEAEAELELAKALETQLEDLGSNDSVKSSVSGANPVVDDGGVEDFLDPQLLSALKSIGFNGASTVKQGHEEPEPVKSVANKGENSGQERTKLEEQIKVEKVKALNFKRAGKQTEALGALRRAKELEKKMNSLAS
ncbi:hypothetical protein RHGRI_037358 [Rhododendron griersonianum]|uniref:FYVE-type domain-containing protein n=1 Tax=Rhododendron griersonianum TaxID=479676 RepID=A0AAV6HRE3_9ERIC|nr:hypothetical protein RHGRI_037358 [Rhododendron griersonianum]